MAPPRILKPAECARVLSIQSHTVHGYVGNKSAVFPMQTLGLEVDFVNTVQFSNHTGYESFTGTALEGNALRNTFVTPNYANPIQSTILISRHAPGRSFSS